jgi:hypothetical protein
MGEEEALVMCTNDAFLDTVVALSDAIAANSNIAVLTLGELPDITRKQVPFLALSASSSSSSSSLLEIGAILSTRKCKVLRLASRHGLLSVPSFIVFV